jgi:hypothetical protein
MHTIYKNEHENLWLKSDVSGELTKLKLVKNHPELGKFYAFNSVLSMPYQRKIMFDLIQQYNNLGIDKDELIKENEEILILIQDRDKGFENKVYNKIANINNTAKSFWDYKKSSMLIATLLIVHESDLTMVGIFDQEIAEKRIKEWSRDADLLGFFLNIAQQKCNSLINKFDNDTRDYSVTEFPSTENQTSIKGENLLTRTMRKFSAYLKI